MHSKPIPTSRSLHSHVWPLIDWTHSAGIWHSPSGIKHLLYSTIVKVSFITKSNSSVSLSNDCSIEFELKIDLENAKGQIKTVPNYQQMPLTCINKTSWWRPFSKLSWNSIKSINIQLLTSSVAANKIEKYLIKCPIISIIWSTFTVPFTASCECGYNSFIVKFI